MRHDQTTPSHAARLALAVAATITSSTIPVLAGTTIFAPGVTEKTGWYDVNKKSTQNKPTIDLNMCWAAVSSNMLQYWQDGYTYAGNKLPANIPNGAGSKIYTPGYDCYELAIFETYLDNWDTSVPGQIFIGISWYFSGEVPNYANSAKPITSNSGGFFAQEYSSLQELLGANFTMNSCDAYSTWGPWAEDQSRTCLSIFSDYVSTILKKGVGGINFNTSTIGGGHTTTLWGADFDDSGMVTAVYVTDSDDAMSTISTSGLKKYGISSNNSNRRVYLSDYSPSSNYGNVEITGLFGLTAYPIPEPSAFGLFAGIGALVLIGLRRPRRI